jgi:hypothetical protein
MVYRSIRSESLNRSSILKPHPNVYVSLRRRLGRTTSGKVLGCFTRRSWWSSGSYCSISWFNIHRFSSDTAAIPFWASSRRSSVYLIYSNTLFSFLCTIMAAVDYVKILMSLFIFFFFKNKTKKKDLMDFLVL